MKRLYLKLSFILCFLVLGLGYANAQFTNGRDNAGFKVVEFRTGANAGSESLSHAILNNSGGSGVTYSGIFQPTESNRYNYRIILNSHTGSYNYGYLLFDYQMKVPPYVCAKVTLLYATIHLYNNASTAVECASAFYVFDSVEKARTTYLVCKPSSTRPADPDGGKLYNFAYNSGSGVYSSTAYNNITYFDNSTSATEQTITKGAIFTTCAKQGNRNQTGYLLIYPKDGKYYTVSYDYYKQITFNPNGGKGEMSKQAIANSASLNNNEFTRDGFTFAGWNTKPDGSGTSYNAGATITANASDKGELTLYAQWTPDPIEVKFDYTFRTSETAGVEKYEHMTTEDAGFTDKVRATFYDHNKAVITSQILTAPGATTPTRDGSPDANIDTHKTATITLNVVKGESVSLTPNDGNGSATYTLTLDATNFAKYSSVDFEVMKADESGPAAHWVTDEESATSYIFKYEGHTSANMFNLKWRVNLKELSMYPSDIFAKPVRKGTHNTDDGCSANTFEQIPAMENIKGIECKLAGYIDADNQDVTIEAYNDMTPEQKAAFNKTGGAYYEGEYNVLKTCAHGQVYNYRIGLTGFILDGNPYYLAETPGDIPDDMISSTAVVPPLNNETDNTKIVYVLDATKIPVLILSPNGEGATVGGRADYKLYVDNNTNVDDEGKRFVSLSQFVAIRPNYELVGWKDAYEETKVYGINENYIFNIGTKATTTLLAQWERSSAPTASYTIEEVGNDFKYVVTAADAINDVKSVMYIITETDATPAANATGWSVMPKQDDGTYIHTFPMLNENRGKYIWAKAANADKSAIISMGQIRSIIKLQAIQNPDSQKPETETIDETPTTINYYDYYTTLFYRDHSFIANDNVSAYTVEEQGGQLKLVKIEPTGGAEYAIIPNGTAVVLRKEHSTDNVIVLDECEPATYSGGVNVLEGVENATTPGSNSGNDYYIFGYNATYAMGFYLKNPATLAAHTAFIKKETNEQNPTQYTLNFDDSTVTGINDITVNGAANGATYDLLGRKVKATNAKSGIYIKDGKKIFIKE